MFLNTFLVCDANHAKMVQSCYLLVDHKLLNLEDYPDRKHGQKEKHERYTFSQFLYLYQFLESILVISIYSDNLNNSFQ